MKSRLSYNGLTAGDRALYSSAHVKILALRWVSGGVAADVQRDFGAGGAWPWTVTEFTVAASQLRPIPA